MAFGVKIVKSEDKIVAWSRIALMWAAIIALLFSARALKSWSNSVPSSRTVTVSADGKAVVVPNLATVSFSVVSEGVSATAIQDDNAKKMNAAIVLVKGFKIGDKDIKTSAYNLSPRYAYEQKTGKSRIDGYQITQTVTVKVRNLDDAGKIVGALPSVGVNQISGPDFSVENMDAFLHSARAEAFDKAYAKVMELAHLAGAGVGRVVTFSESTGSNYPRPMYMKADMGMGGEASSAPQFEAGSDEAHVTVSVTYELR
ncbi:MAG: DUF541 domain-containing protein [Candidatus Pacebacteria bacterium]|nr:DUF541 domain-containing protein [Candidatus Paceibacterota bacterium]